MFFVPPKLEPLGYDLGVAAGLRIDDLGLRGWKTRCGRSLDLDYEYGYVRVTLDGAIILDTRIGPAADPIMTIEQACEVLGLRLRGERVRLSAEQRAELSARGYADFSGATTYWDRDAVLDVQDMRDMVAGFLRRVPGTLALRLFSSATEQDAFGAPRLHSIQDDDLAGAGEAGTRAYLIASGAPPTTVDGWRVMTQYRTRLLFHTFWVERPAHHETVDSRRYEIRSLHRTLITGQCSSDDRAGMDFLAAFQAEMDERCTNRVCTLDLATGAVIEPDIADLFWYGASVRDWVLSQPDRLLRVRDAAGPPHRKLGVRPVVAA